MNIKEILWEFTHRCPENMYYTNEEGKRDIIWYLDNYHPYRQQGVKNWRFDEASSVMLRFKQGQPEAIGYYLLKILGKFSRKAKFRNVIEDDNLRFAVVPGHKAEKMIPVFINWRVCCRLIMAETILVIAFAVNLMWQNCLVAGIGVCFCITVA